jgi:hypothetical protein
LLIDLDERAPGSSGLIARLLAELGDFPQDLGLDRVGLDPSSVAGFPGLSDVVVEVVLDGLAGDTV